MTNIDGLGATVLPHGAVVVEVQGVAAVPCSSLAVRVFNRQGLWLVGGLLKPLCSADLSPVCKKPKLYNGARPSPQQALDRLCCGQSVQHSCPTLAIPRAASADAANEDVWSKPLLFRKICCPPNILDGQPTWPTIPGKTGDPVLTWPFGSARMSSASKLSSEFPQLLTYSPTCGTDTLSFMRPAAPFPVGPEGLPLCMFGGWVLWGPHGGLPDRVAGEPQVGSP